MLEHAPVNQDDICILTVNGGSSSIKFALYRKGILPASSKTASSGLSDIPAV
jgi:acetate kinase